MPGTTAVHRAALQTIAYFHLFHYAPTETDVWQWLWQTPADLFDVVSELRDSNNQAVALVGPFVTLVGEEEDAALRPTRYRYSTLKLGRARHAARFLGMLPWVEGVAACNSLGYQNARPESDIDLFIITKPNTIWLCRFLAVSVAHFLGARPTVTHTADGLCFSFWVTTETMNLAPLALTGGDPYLTFWISQLTPLFGRVDVWERFWQSNVWVHNALPNTPGYHSWPHAFYRSGRQTRRGGGVLSWVNNFLGQVQRARLPYVIRAQAGEAGSSVVITNSVLKFHTQDRRAAYRDAWRSLCAERNVPLA